MRYWGDILFVHWKQKRPNPKYKQFILTQNAEEKPILKALLLTLGMKEWIADVIFEYLMFHFVFVYWAAWMPISDRQFIILRAAGTSKSLNFSLPVITFCDLCN